MLKKTIYLAPILLSAMQVSSANASPASMRAARAARAVPLMNAKLTVAGPNAPAGVPSDYVLTPNGYSHPSCVMHLEADEHIDEHGIVRGDGSRRAATPCAHPRYNRTGAQVSETPTTIGHSWLADVDDVVGGAGNPSGSSVVDFYSDWSVPDSPDSVQGATVFFFPGLQSSDNNILIIQPVVAWNGWNDNAWTITSWNCCFQGNQIYYGPYPTTPGHQIDGGLEGYNCTGDFCANWYVVTYDVTADAAMVLDTYTQGLRFNWLFGGAVEVYNLSSCTNLPSSFNVTFNNISAQSSDGSFMSPSWTTHHFDDQGLNCDMTFGFGQSTALYPSGTAWSWLVSWYDGDGTN